MTRNHPDQRKGSMEGNWATTAAIPNRRKGHVRMYVYSLDHVAQSTISLMPAIYHTKCTLIQRTHIFAAKVAFGMRISK